MKNVRLYFQKKGRMKFTSHLDITRFMARLIQKSKIPVWFTEGFNQHIYMNFALPLSLGFESNYEVMDIRLTDDNYPLEKCLESMKKACPPDINFFDCKEPVLPSKEIGFADFVLTFEKGNEEILLKLTDFLKKDSILCEKVGKKGKIKEIDLIPKIAGYGSNHIDTVKFRLVAGSEDNLNPNLVLDTFFKEENISPVYYSVCRTMILDKEGNNFK